MTWNILAYLIYLLLTGITIRVLGRALHSNGIYFVRKVFVEETTADTVNNLLLLGYYLINLGYAFLTLASWATITSFGSLLGELSQQLGAIYLLLALLHYNNILCLRLYARWQGIKFINH